MGRKRTGLDGKKIEESKNLLGSYFDELTEEAEQENTNPAVETVEKVEENDTPELAPKNKEENEQVTNTIEDKISSLPKVEPEGLEGEIIDNPPTPTIRNGKIMITSDKPKKMSFTDRNRNGKYNLVKKSWENKKQLQVVSKSVRIRPDLKAILEAATKSDGDSYIYGLQGTIFQNALIKELVYLGVLDKDSYSELIDYQ